MSGKQRRHAFDVDAWVQFHLLRLASFHAKTTKADLAVLAEIIQRYWGKYGNGWVTHEKLGEMAGISKSTVIRAKGNLERLGFITVVQAGRRGSATVYRPNFELVPAKGSKDDTESFGVMDATETAYIGGNDATLIAEYGITDDTPSYLPDRPTRAESQIDRGDCTAPTAPLAVGLAATSAGTAQDGFEELWKAYDYRQRKTDARAAYTKLAPSAEQHATMVATAVVWRERWAAQGKADAPRFTLAKWIEREEFECDPPTAYQPKERKAKPERPDKPAAKPTSAKRLSKPLRILSIEEIGNPFEQYALRLRLDDADGNVCEKTMSVFLPGNNDHGPSYDAYADLIEAMPDKSQWVGARLQIEADGETILNAAPAKAGDRVVNIVEANLTDVHGRQRMIAELQGEHGDGTDQPEGFIVIDDVNAGGRSKLAALGEAIGLKDVQDTDELLFKPFLLTDDGDFLPIAANDNEQSEAA